MAAEADHPLLATLPPKSDYLTYLTVIEYNLNKDDLPLLNDLLKDETLTTNIGWDLVLLLLPFVPASEPCLITIAKLGNPREVLLKVTEALRFIEFAEEDEEEDETKGKGPNVLPEQGQDASAAQQQDKARPQDQFIILLSMLSILHRRIKTKYPSRFIATTLQGALAAYSSSDSEHRSMIEAVDRFVREIASSGRPVLPPRNSSEPIPQDIEKGGAADPEAYLEPPSQREKLIIDRLVQSFVTHITEAYMLAISSSTEVPGLGWASKIFEDIAPAAVVPGRTTMKQRFSADPKLIERELCVRILTKLGHDLSLTHDSLLKSVIETQAVVSLSSSDEEEPPNAPEDVSLSQYGSFFLLTARIADEHLQKNPEQHQLRDVDIFPDQCKMLRNILGTERAGGLSTAGSEPLSLIDSSLALGLVAMGDNLIGRPSSDEEFTQYLQLITLLSANTSEPNLRFYAHFLASSVLRTHPSDLVRLAFIRDTLEHCPIENLKASAVSWIKGETMEAFSASASDSARSGSSSVFANPIALQSLAPFLFPDVTQELGSTDLMEKWTVFKSNLGFYLASLNFYYFLLVAQHLHEPLAIPSLHTNNDIGGSMLGPLREAVKEFKESVNNGELAEMEGEQGIISAISDFAVLNDVLDRVEQGVAQLNKVQIS